MSEDQKAEYKFSDKYGKYRLLGLRQRGVASLREDRPEMFFPIYVNPADQSISLTEIQGWHRVVPKKSDGREGRWMWGKQKCKTEWEIELDISCGIGIMSKLLVVVEPVILCAHPEADVPFHTVLLFDSIASSSSRIPDTVDARLGSSSRHFLIVVMP